MTSAPFLQRHLGEYLLVAQLSEDSLGTVFRALYAPDERRFVRLRILQSEELSRHAVLAAIRGNAPRIAALEHEAIVLGPQLDVLEDIPFLAWDEAAGWTLDALIARVRALDIRIPVEYALLIVERIAAALEHGHQTTVDGRAFHHGLLWPGFVSISYDAAVRVGGFGIAEAVLPTLGAPRISAEIAPYVAPEARSGGPVGANSDVYSLGAILIELTTGRKPSLDTPSTELRAGDPRSEEVGTFLRRCMAEPERRFASAVDAHRALQQMVTGNPFSLYTANLALFLYKLLNPESQSVVSSSDWDSTNPVLVQTATKRSDAEASGPTPPPGTPRRRRGDAEPADVSSSPDPGHPRPPQVAASPRPAPPRPSPVAATAFPTVAALSRLAAARLSAGRAASLRIGAAGLARTRAAAAASAAAAVSAARLATSKTSSLGRTGAGKAGETFRTARLRLARAASSLRPMMLRLAQGGRTRRASVAAAAAGAVIGVVLISIRLQAARPAPHPESMRAAADVSVPLPRNAAATAPAPDPAPAGPDAQAPAEPPPGRIEKASRRARRPKTEDRQPAEDLRLRAALARVEAERLNASQAASDLFGRGRSSEQEGEQLLRQREYEAAGLAFSQAAQLFQRAQEVTWEERLRRANLSSSP
jgi:serine/threonine protein kinase